MSTVLVTRFKNRAEAERAVKALKEQGISFESRIDDIEDMYLAKLIDEGMQEEGEVDFDEFFAELIELKEKADRA